MTSHQKIQVRKFFNEFLLLNNSEQLYFFKLWADELDKDSGLFKRIADLCFRKWFGEKGIEQWMERRFQGDMSLTPKRVAYECRYYFRLRRKMEPWLVYLAQKVKRKLYMREVRASKRSGVDGVTGITEDGLSNGDEESYFTQ